MTSCMGEDAGHVSTIDELRFSREQGFFDKSRTLRYSIGVFFAVSLFLFVHYREVRIPVMEIDAVADRYVVAPIEFEFLDSEATFLHRQEAAKDIGKIHKLFSPEVRQARIDFENHLIHNQTWRRQAEHSTFDEMYQAVDLLEGVLLRIRFSDPRTLQKMKSLHLPIRNYQIYQPTELGRPSAFPKQIWEAVQEMTFAENLFQMGTIRYVIHFFSQRVWKLEEDLVTEKTLKSLVRSHVQDRYTKVRAGTQVIEQGEKITPRHVAMLQAMKRKMTEERQLWHPMTAGGSALFTLLLTALFYIYLRMNHPDIVRSNRRLFLLVSIMILTGIFAKTVEFFLVHNKANLAEIIRYPAVIPFAAILLCSLLSPQVATFVSGFLAIVFSVTLAVDWRGFLLLNLVVAEVAILSTRSLKQRKEIFAICGKAFVVGILLLFSLQLYEGPSQEVGIVGDVVTLALSMLLTSVIVVGLLPIFETMFGVMTDVTLMEYMDPNHELLRRLSMEAPGTYQHSVVVGNLAEAAALAIGANGLFCRVATLYHDIGKLTTAHYFTENQQGGMNMHQLLTPNESAQVIISHVIEGVAMGRKVGLPEPFIDIIKEHHGTTLVYYFYRKQLEQCGNDESQVREADFRYAGPKPRSKESAIIMIADSLEAASRSLDEVNETSLTQLVNKLVADKAEDGQFSDCSLTFRELEVVKKTMVTTLLASGHSRIKYPEKMRKQPLPPPLPEGGVPLVAEVGVRETTIRAVKQEIQKRKEKKEECKESEEES